MKAKKENKSYRITTEVEKQRYLKEGYDIYDDNGTLLEYSPLKKIAYSEYAKLQKENASLAALQVRNAELEAENAELRSKILEQEAQVDSAEKKKKEKAVKSAEV